MLLVTATEVLAAPPTVSNPHPTLQEPPPAETATSPVARMIADFFDFDVAQVQTWHDDTGLGYGEIAIALFLSQSSGEDAEEIIRLHQEKGLGWGEVARALDLAPGNRGRNLEAIMSGRTVLTLRAEVERGRGQPEVPPGWEHGKEQGLERGQGRGHNK